MNAMLPRASAWVFPAVASAVLLSASAFLLAQKPDKKPADKKPAIKDIMMRSHTKEGPLNKLGQALKGKRWDEAATMSAQLVKGGEDLTKAVPPKKGPAASWEKLTKQYLADTLAIQAAVEKKDAAGAKEGLETLNASCRTCHGVHK